MSAIRGDDTISLDAAFKEIDRLSRSMEETGLPPLQCSFTCDNKGGNPEKFEQLVDKVISFVSRAYAIFPQLEEGQRQQLWEHGVAITELEESDLPSQQECDRFEYNLKKKIISLLKVPMAQYFHPRVYLSTDFGPEGVLGKVCEASFSNKNDIQYFFPRKTGTRIIVNDTRSGLLLQMKF